MNKINILFILFFMLVGCEQAWENYFTEDDDTGVRSSQNIYQYLQDETRYSKFTKLLEETGVCQTLQGNHMITVWAPCDSVIPDNIFEQIMSQKIRFVKNHINNIAYNKVSLRESRNIITLAGKLLKFEYQDSVSLLDNKQILKMDKYCKNGVVHEVRGILEPKQSVYEYILESGEDYSVFRDTLMAYNDTTFMPELSIPSGTDEIGNTVYSDSVFDIKNQFLPNRLQDDEEQTTYLLPTNRAVNQMMVNITNFFRSIDRDVTRDDTLKIMNWLMKGVVHSGRITNYGSTKNRTSYFGTLWRTDKQVVNGNYKEFSNGVVYKLEGIQYPKFNYMEKILIRPHYILTQMSMEEQKAYISTSSTASAKHSYTQNNDMLWVTISGKQTDAYVEFSSVIRTMYGEVKPVNVMPGIYKLCASYRAYACKEQLLSVVVKDEVIDITKFNPGAGATGNNNASSKRGKFEFVPVEHAGKADVPNGSNGLLTDEFVVKQDWGYNILRLRLTNTGGSDRTTPIYFYLEPTEENY